MTTTKIQGTKKDTPDYTYVVEKGYSPYLVMVNGTHIWTKIGQVEWRDRDGKIHKKWNWGYATSSGGGQWWSEENTHVEAPHKDKDWTYIPESEYLGRWKQ